MAVIDKFPQQNKNSPGSLSATLTSVRFSVAISASNNAKPEPWPIDQHHYLICYCVATCIVHQSFRLCVDVWGG